MSKRMSSQHLGNWPNRATPYLILERCDRFTREPLIDPDSSHLRLLTIPDPDWQRLKKTSVDKVAYGSGGVRLVSTQVLFLSDGQIVHELRPDPSAPMALREQQVMETMAGLGIWTET
jgi:hypothetical protein